MKPTPTPLLPVENVIGTCCPPPPEGQPYSLLFMTTKVSQTCHSFRLQSSDPGAFAQAVLSFRNARPCFSESDSLPGSGISSERPSLPTVWKLDPLSLSVLATCFLQKRQTPCLSYVLSAQHSTGYIIGAPKEFDKGMNEQVRHPLLNASGPCFLCDCFLMYSMKCFWKWKMIQLYYFNFCGL